MSGKTKLSDGLLDAVAGGTFTYGGKVVKEMASTQDGTTITLADGTTADLEWNEETRSRLYASLGSASAVAREVDGKHFDDDQTFALEDYVKSGNGIRG